MTNETADTVLPKRKKIVKHVCLNPKEANTLWIPAQALYGDLGDSETIKRALKDALTFSVVCAAADRKGINLIKFLDMEAGK